MARKYGKKAQKEVAKEMRRFKRGTARSGRKEHPVESREQAIAIALSKARKKGAKVPKKAKRKTTPMRPARKRRSTKRSSKKR